MLSADDVLNAKFQATKFREGYDQDEVDDFLDLVVSTLRAREGGPATPRPLTAQDVAGQRFQATKFREGYDQDEVDAFLDRVVEALGGAPSALGRQPGRPTRAATSSSSAVTEERRGWFRRRRR